MATARQNTSVSGSSRLSLSVGKLNASQPAGRHPLKHDWSISYVHRPPGAKVDYEKEIKRVATFGSIESFLHLYSHLTSPADLPAVTDVLVFLSRIGRPGVWEEMRDGGKFTMRLVHPITPLLFESLLFALIGDQFEESDSVVGCVLSVRNGEDIMSVWVEEEGDAVRSGQLREKILTLLNLPSSTLCEYKANKALLDAASKPPVGTGDAHQATNNHHHHNNNNSNNLNHAPNQSQHQHHHHHNHHHGHNHNNSQREGQHNQHSNHTSHQPRLPGFRGGGYQKREEGTATGNGETRNGWER